MVTIRPAQPSDAESILALAQAFATSFKVSPQAFHTAFAELLISPSDFVGVAEMDGTIVGYVLGCEHNTFYANGRVAWVEEIMVSSDCRRMGSGRLLMQAFEAWALKRGARLVALATRRAAAFYKALGYEESATYWRKVLVFED